MEREIEDIMVESNVLSEKILDQIPTTVFAVDKNLNLLYLNSAGQNLIGDTFENLKGKKCSALFKSAHCNTENCCMVKALKEGRTVSARNEIQVDGRKVPIEYYASPLVDSSGTMIGGVEYVVDITERVKHEERVREQSRTIREISTPAIKLWDEVVVLPVVGVVDSARAQQMMERMLDKIIETSAKAIILDIQGVAAVDTAVANHLIKISRATKLMGCHCIISGISPAVAQTIVHLGVDMEGVQTNSTLRDALADALKYVNLEICPMKNNN